ncbi:MAG: hypothetical protein ACI80V_003231 [Rhodothermales bacterium]
MAIGDVDGDGLPDVFMAGLQASSRLYRNLGAWRFDDVTDASGLDLSGVYNTGAAFVDADGDADLDLVTTLLDGPSALWLNDGSGVFSEDASWPGRAAGARGGTTITAADVDGDSDLDIYITNYKRRTVKDLYHPREISFDRTVEQVGDQFTVIPPYDQHYKIQRQEGRVMRYEYGEADALLVNDGAGFRDVTTEAFSDPEGLATDWGLTAQFRDLDGDNDPDLYVSNDFESPDRIWLNDGSGSFTPAPILSVRHTAQSSMAVDGSDVDRDGRVDLFVTEMLSRTHERRLRQVGSPPPIIPGLGQVEVRPQVMHNTLLMASAGPAAPGFIEAARAFDVAASEWSWSAIFLDVDLDGWEDLLISTGHRYDAMDLDTQTSMSGMPSADEWTRELLEFPTLDLPNVAFRNEGGTHFSEMARGWGLGETGDVTHGMAFGDLDGDGDLDIVTNRLNGAAGVFRNDTEAPRIAVRLVGRDKNPFGIGATIRVSGGGFAQSKEILAGGQYLSGSEAKAVFAAPEDSMRLEVTWRRGHSTSLKVAANTLVEISEPIFAAPAPASDRPDTPDAPSAKRQPRFDVEALATHQEPLFEDRARQALLLRRLSQEGPYAASGDLTGDGQPDVVIGTGAGGRPAVYLNDGGVLTLADASAYPVSGQDMTGLAITEGRIMAAVSGYESDSPSRLDQYTILNGVLQDRGEIDLGNGSPGPLAVADINGDGFEDLFVGMRFLPNRYPESVPSPFFLREGDGWVRGGQLPAGLITGAAFADVDGDRDQDLAVSTEWGSVRIYENDGKGNFEDASPKWGTSGLVGLWRSARWADLNTDGLPDLITTNWGWNSPYGRVGAVDFKGPGPRLYWADFDRNGSIDPVEAEYAPGIGAWAPTMKLMDLLRGLRYVSRRVGSAMEYANSTLVQILGPAAENAPFEELNQLGHVVWINTGSSFKPHILPDQAQWAPASDVAAVDLNGDGNLDLVLSQNFFPVLPEDATRQDGGTGLMLLGDGTGAFSPGGALGVYGDGRAMEMADLDRDGAPELIVTQNAAPAYVYRLVR